MWFTFAKGMTTASPSTLRCCMSRVVTTITSILTPMSNCTNPNVWPRPGRCKLSQGRARRLPSEKVFYGQTHKRAEYFFSWRGQKVVKEWKFSLLRRHLQSYQLTTYDSLIDKSGPATRAASILNPTARKLFPPGSGCNFFLLSPWIYRVLGGWEGGFRLFRLICEI